MKNFKNYLVLISASVIFAGIYLLNHKSTLRPAQDERAYPVQEITSFTQAENVLKLASSNTLILFDVDDVLITSPDYFARGHLPWWIGIRLLFAFPEFLKEEVTERLHGLMFQKAPRVLIELQVVDIINNLKNQGALVIGLTSMESGGYGVVTSMPLWRADMLKGLGIVFSQKYPNQVYTELPAHRNNYPVLFEGILCTNQQPKGAVLAAFLDTNNLDPANIIFFDDSMSNLQSVGKTCAEHNIPCTLFQYRGAERFSNTLDMASVIKQIGILLHEQRWVSDSEIDRYKLDKNIGDYYKV